MENQSESQASALKKIKGIFDYAVNHPCYIQWRRRMIDDYGFFDGDGQWEKEVVAELERRGQPAITINKIKPMVNYMSGIEIQTRFRVAFRTHSKNEQKEELAKALTNLVYYFQEQHDVPHSASLKFKDCLISGIGWSNIYKTENEGIVYEYVNPADVIYDADDLSPELRNGNHVCRLRFLTIDECKVFWPKSKSYFNKMLSKKKPYGSPGGQSIEIFNRKQVFSGNYCYGSGSEGSKILVVEVQYKVREKSYKGFDKNGFYFETFDEDFAKELAIDPKSIQESHSFKIMRGLFTDNILLEHAPLEPALPNLPDFTYIPCVYSRIFKTGVPQGWVQDMKDPQRDYNYRRSQIAKNLASFRVIADADAFGAGKTEEDVADNIKRTDSVLYKTPGSEVKIESNMPLAQGHFELLTRTDQEFQQVTGLHNDALGKESNATSGVAIQARQVNSVRHHVTIFDSLKMMKKREGRMFLAFLQGGGYEFLETEILSEDERKTVTLNIVREIDGKRFFQNDIRTLPLDIYVEEVPDFESSLEEQQLDFINLLANPRAFDIMQSEEALRRLKIRDAKKLAEEMRHIGQQQMAMKQGAQQLPAPQTALGDPTQLPNGQG